MAWWLIALLTLGVVVGAFGVLVAIVSGESRHRVRYMSVDFGEPFLANTRRGAAIGDFWFSVEKDDDGRRVGVAKYRDSIHEPWRRARVAVADFPLELAHHRVRGLDGGRFVIEPVPYTDEEFLRNPGLAIPKVGPTFRGVRIAAPSAIRWAEGEALRKGIPMVGRPFPSIPIACVYLISSEELGRDARDDDVTVHLRIDGKDHSMGLDHARRAFRDRMYGVDETVHHRRPGPQPEPSPGPLEGRAAGSSFALDIGWWIEPRELPTEVEVFVECAGARSNRVTISLAP